MRSGFLLLVFFLLPLLAADRAEAYMVSGTLELDYDTLRTTSTDAGGNTVSSQGRDFTQQYTLNVNLSPSSTVNASGGLLATKTEGSGQDSTTSVQPYVDVTLRDPFNIYSAGAGYRQLKTTTRSAAAPPQAYVSEQYHSFLGWTPVELPVFNIQASRTNTYDTTRTLQNDTTDSALFNARYAPRKEWDLAASLSYADDLNRVDQLKTVSVNESGRVNYANTFWRRVSLSTGYTVGLSTTTTSQQGTGTVPFQRFPVAGYSVTADFPAPTDNLGASPNGALIDGNSGVSAGVNIGTSVSLPTDNKFREMGVDFGTATEVNNVLIWTNQPLTTDTANSFAWEVYTSADNTSWTLLQTVQPAVFGPFVNRFSIDFQNVNTRYLKVATRPLSLAVQGATDPTYQNIYVTEMETFDKMQAAEVRGESSNMSQQFHLSTSTRIAEGVSHVLSYNRTESLSKAGGTEATSVQYTLSNGLNVTRPFKIGPTLTANARFSRDDAFSSTGTRQGAYNYGAGLSAVPLNTLRGSLQYSGSTSDDGSKSDSLMLNSTADLYPGVSVSAMGGMNSSLSGVAGMRSNGVSFRTSAGIVPHRALTLSLNYSMSRQATTSSDVVSAGERWDAGATYRPFDALYLSATVSRLRQTDQNPATLHNYGLSWSPFAGGTVQFGFTYTESWASDTDTLTKTIGPTLSWAVAPWATITLSYYAATTSSPQTSTDVKSMFGQYKMNF